MSVRLRERRATGGCLSETAGFVLFLMCGLGTLYGWWWWMLYGPP